ncbi:hypothetical protein QQ054_15175 [Oscillatoria amoena NRMC-F 0135]|nr:hypothetical protein [Oscillatoria amoena NRMC-F 0135]
METAFPIEGYRYLIKVQFPAYYTNTAYTWDVEETTFTFTSKVHQSKFNLQPVVDTVAGKSSTEVRHILLPGGALYCNDELTGNRLIIENINLQVYEGKTEIQNFNGILLIK